jgi:hypothetical protein
VQDEDDAQQHDFLGVTGSESAETPISSPPQHSDHEDSEFSLFSSQMSAELMKNFVDNMSRLEGGPRKKPCTVSYSESENSARHTASISLEEFSWSERTLLEIYSERGWAAGDGDKVLTMLRDSRFKLSDIKSFTFRSLLARLDREESEPEFECFDLWVEEDGEQEVKMHARKFKGLFLEILTDAKIGGVNLFADPKIGKDGNRWFTADANSGTWFEEFQEAVGPDIALGAACAFFDAAHIWQNMGVMAVYGTLMHL